MAKKTTQKKAAKTEVKKKAPSTKTKKTTSNTAKREPASKKTTKKTARKKPAAKKTGAVKNKAPTKKPPKKTTQTQAAPDSASPADNGKSAALSAKPTPPKIHRVVRPTPPPAEPVIDDWTPLNDAKLRKVKTGLTRKNLNTFKQLLLVKRAELVGDVLNMEESRAAGNSGDLSNMPLHMADIGSDNYEQEFTIGLVESERKLLIEIDAALMRIKNRTYGVCIVTGTPIPTARLDIKPWAKYSIEVVREREKHGLHSF